MNTIVGGIQLQIFGDLESLVQTVVFYLHGRQGESIVVHVPGQAKDCSKYCQDLAEIDGCISITFDARNHGNRLIDPLRNESWVHGNRDHALDMYSIMLGTTQDVSLLIDLLPLYYPQLSQVRWGVAGISLGGHTALLALGLDTRLTMGVSIIGCGDYRSLMMDRVQKTPPELLPNPPLPSHFLDLLKMKDPIHHTADLVKKDILLLTGGLDELVPGACNADFLKKMMNASRGSPNCFKEVIDPQAGHTFSPLMKQETKSWFAKVFQAHTSIRLNVKINS